MGDIEVDCPNLPCSCTTTRYTNFGRSNSPFDGRKKSFSKVDASLVSPFGETEHLPRNQFQIPYMFVDNDSNDIDMVSDDHSEILSGIKASSSRTQEPEKQDAVHQSGTKAIYPSSTNREKVSAPISMAKSVFFGTEYKMDHRKIGRALVINNMRYADRRQRPEREDSIKDASAMTNLLETLSFEPVTRRSGGQKEILINDVSSSQLMDIIKDARDPALNDYSDCDCFVMVILSYGIDGAVMCCEGETDKLIPVEQIISQFQADKCPSLAMKPKLFFMQLCPAFTYNIADCVKDTGSSSSRLQPEIQSIPTEADILCQVSTIPGIYGWYEDNSALSWYIEGLKEALQKHLYNPLRDGRRSGEIFDVIFHVNGLYLGKLEEQGIRPSQSYSVPHTTSTLTKSLHFLPKNRTM